MTELAVDQPVVNEAAAPTVAAAKEAASAADVSDIPSSSDANSVSEATETGVAKGEGAPETASTVDTSPGEKKVDDPTSSQPLESNDNALLNCGETDGGSAEVTNKEESAASNEVGSSHTETNTPSANAIDIFGDGPATDGQPAPDPGSDADLLGTVPGDSASSDDQQPPIEPTAQTQLPPSEEAEADAGEVAAENPIINTKEPEAESNMEDATAGPTTPDDSDTADATPGETSGETPNVAESIPQPTLVDIPPLPEASTNKADTNPSPEKVTEETVERTQEEEEWLSMGLGLGDALRQIVALTEERDSALVICQEKDDGQIQVESVLVEVQSKLEAEMNQRAEAESQVRQVRATLKTYEDRLAAYEKMEDDLERAQANLVTVVSEKSKIELEVQKLRELRDESEQKEVVLSNRLNDAKKKEANKSKAAGSLEADNEQLKDELQTVKEELETTSKAKAKLETTMEKLKTKAVERVKQAETALSEERELNEERKKKMKVFVETKADELREAKESAGDMQKELEETRASLRSSRDREEASIKELESARLKHRELQRDVERMKRNSEQLHKMGAGLEQELEKSASETEEHRKKRMSAKHEIMQMVRTLEVERAVSSKLRESIKFNFSPKALSQQELLTEALRDFELELERLAAKTGKVLLPSPESSEHIHSAQDGPETPDGNGAYRKSRKTRSKADVDTERLISNLEHETQHVSKGILALSKSIERMHSLLSDDNAFGCMTYLSNILAGTGEARHQRLRDDSEAQEERYSNDQFV